MNTPNKLTVLRMILVPIFIFFFLCWQITFNYLWATLFFAAAAITDCIDGHIARKRNLVTDFGKFLDPLADKILIISAIICFISLELTGPVMVIIILARDFLVTSLRLVASEKGTVIAANRWGKAKTISQMVAVVVTLVLLASSDFTVISHTEIRVVSQILLWISTALAVISGAIYLWQNRAFLSGSAK